MKRHALRSAFVLSVVVTAALGAYLWVNAIDYTSQARYARDLRRLQTLDAAVNEAVLRARSGLLLQYDPLVAAFSEIRRLNVVLRDVPPPLTGASGKALRGRLEEADGEFGRKAALVEEFKSENSVLQNSVRYFPILATEVVTRLGAVVSDPASNAQTPIAGANADLAARVHVLSSALMLFQTESDETSTARVQLARAALATEMPAARGAGLERELELVLTHSQLIVEREPRVAELVRHLLRVPSGEAALRAEQQYSTAYREAVDANLSLKQVWFVLLLSLVVLASAEVILAVRRAAKALQQLTGELRVANDALALEHEKERRLGELRSRFVAMTSHEFRTPLTAILSSVELLQQFGERWDAERRGEHLERVRLSARSMERMLEDVLTIGRAEAGVLRASPSPIRLDDFCRRLVEALQHSTRESHIVKYSFDGDPEVALDERLLQHVLGNLLGNAVKYSAPGSEVRFEVRTNPDECHFAVADQGIGIPAEETPTLFESFSRASNAGNAPGSGLGLAVVKKALDVQQGSIEVESELGSGTTFRVRIPRRLVNVDTPLT